MGLFGLFYAAIGLGAKGIGAIKDAQEDNIHRSLYYDEETNTYLDHNMTRRDINTNRVMHIKKDFYTGNIYVEDAENGKIIKNLSEERAMKKYLTEKRKAENGVSERTHIRYGDDQHRQDTYPGYRYKDFKTGKLYIARCFGLDKEDIKELNLNWNDVTLYLLIDYSTEKFVRLTDRSIEKLLDLGATLEEINDFYPKFKNKIEKTIDEPYSNRWWNLKDYFCCRGTTDGQEDSIQEGNFITEKNKYSLYRRGIK